MNLGDRTKRLGKHQAFTVPICGNEKLLELGAWCLISETFLYLSAVIHLIGRCLIGEVLRYIKLAEVHIIYIEFHKKLN